MTLNCNPPHDGLDFVVSLVVYKKKCFVAAPLKESDAVVCGSFIPFFRVMASRARCTLLSPVGCHLFEVSFFIFGDWQTASTDLTVDRCVLDFQALFLETNQPGSHREGLCWPILGGIFSKHRACAQDAVYHMSSCPQQRSIFCHNRSATRNLIRSKHQIFSAKTRAE